MVGKAIWLRGHDLDTIIEFEIYSKNIFLKSTYLL